MKRQIFIVVTLSELQSLIGEFLGITAYDTLLDDMREKNANPEWCCDVHHYFEVVTEDKWITENHRRHLAEVREKNKVEWGWEIEAILNQLARDGRIEHGEYLVEGWSE